MKTLLSIMIGILVVVSAEAQNPSFTVTRNDAVVLNQSPLADGVALGCYGFYDSCQVTKNLLAGAGTAGLEPVRPISIWVQEAAGTGIAGTATSNAYHTRNLYVAPGATAVFNTKWTGASDTIMQSSNAALVGCTDFVSSVGIVGSENSETGVQYNFVPGTSTAGGTTSGLCGGTTAGTVHVVTGLIETPVNGSALTAGINGVQVYSQSGATVTWDTATPLDGLASARMNTLASGSFAYVAFAYDSNLADRYVAMNGTYLITAKMRLNSGNSTVTMSLTRSVNTGRPQGVLCSSGALTVPSTAANVTFACAANEDGTSSKPDPGTVSLQITGNGNDVEIDDVSIVKTSGQDLTNTSVFRDEYVNGLKQQFYAGHRGLFRFGPEMQNGETFANWTRTDFQALQTGFTAYAVPNPHPRLQDYLQLCKVLGVVPYFHLPMGTTAADAASYTRYLFSTNASDGEVQLRTSQGHSAPWGGPGGDFSTIFISFGNEGWNYADAFVGGDMPGIPSAANQYVQYVQRMGTVFQTMRTQTSFPAASYVQLISNIQFQVAYGWTTQIATMPANGRPDGAEISPYISVPFTSTTSNEAMWRLGLSTPYTQIENSSATIASVVSTVTATAGCGPAGSTSCRVFVYEEGPGDAQACGNTGYPICQTSAATAIVDQQNLQTINVGAGMGLMMADEFMENLANGVIAQNLFESNQTSSVGAPTNPSSGIVDQAYLWGMAVEYGGALSAMDGASVRARPQMLALQVANAAIIGSMTNCTNNAPTYSQGAGPYPLTIPSTTVPVIQSRCFLDGSGNFSIFIANRSTSTAFTMLVAGTNATQTPITIPAMSDTTVTYSSTNPALVSQQQFAPANLSSLNEAPATNPSYSNPSLIAQTNLAPKGLSLAIGSLGSATKMLFLLLGGSFHALVSQ